ncbi:hypothetical protein ACFQPA_14625 [Halomarina halobia]|uniref:Uncharacterized protein n=1 Tax=Halomarina halobia TaxID=3033386 RepID=A0ABD6A7Y5_9EURY|nr:hypothetical protein [Halomarina sp. PSR21]
MDARAVRGDGEDEAARFAAELTDLKRRGCHLLVTGIVSDAVRARQTRNLMGSPRFPRCRLLALVDGDLSRARTYLPGNLDAQSPRVSVLDFSTTRASGGTVGETTSPWPSTPGGDASVPGDELSVLRMAIEREIVDGLPAAGPVPGRLRVGVLTLGALLDTYGVERIRSFVGALGRSVRAASGMGHCQLPLAPDAAETEALLPAFDARVDLRHRDGWPPEQRWYLTTSGETTEWMLL